MSGDGVVSPTPEPQSVLSWLGRNGLLGSAATAVAAVTQRRFGVNDPTVLFAAALTAFAHESGHSCVDPSRLDVLVGGILEGLGDDSVPEPLPTADDLIGALRAHPTVVRLVSVTELPGVDDAVNDRRPLVLVENMLYSQRQFVDELSLAHQVATRAAARRRPVERGDLIDALTPVPAPGDDEARAAGDDGIANRTLRAAVSSRLTVLTGGPGTGKTHTLTRCLAVMLACREDELADLSVALVAPTGKAATRAKELLTLFVDGEKSATSPSSLLSADVLSAMAAIEPRTIHGLLGSTGGRQTRFSHDASNQLPHDIIVVDEMSMVPTHLMARLMEAVRPEASVLLVGDHAQLESVESGSVLREIVEPRDDGSSTREWVFELRRVWRQSSDTRIGDLARLVRDGRSVEAVSLVASEPSGVQFFEIEGNTAVSPKVVSGVEDAMVKVRDLACGTAQEGHVEAHALLSRNKVLCGPRRGSVGVFEWNERVKNAVLGSIRVGELVPGLPLLVTVNSPRARLVNGDIGLVVNRAREDSEIETAIYFPGPDGGRYLTQAELPPWEECFAMTIHKSQGSEYEDLVVILPREDSPLLSRELIYTAITRAKKSLIIAGTTAAFRSAVDNKTVRFSTLGRMIGTLTTRHAPTVRSGG